MITDEITCFILCVNSLNTKSEYNGSEINEQGSVYLT
jgi:hypothetical protein